MTCHQLHQAKQAIMSHYHQLLVKTCKKFKSFHKQIFVVQIFHRKVFYSQHIYTDGTVQDYNFYTNSWGASLSVDCRLGQNKIDLGKVLPGYCRFVIEEKIYETNNIFLIKWQNYWMNCLNFLLVCWYLHKTTFWKHFSQYQKLFPLALLGC